MQEVAGEEWRTKQYERLAREIDWRRDAAIWKGNIVSNDGKIATNRAPVKQAAENVKTQLGLPRSSDGLAP